MIFLAFKDNFLQFKNESPILIASYWFGFITWGLFEGVTSIRFRP
jgi:hypothetical protein